VFELFQIVHGAKVQKEQLVNMDSVVAR